MKAGEDIKVMYDGTVRNAANNIVQFLYGDDGFDPTKLERVNIDLIKYNNLEMIDKYKFEYSTEKDWQNVIVKNTMKELLSTENYKDYLDNEFNILMNYRDQLRFNFFKNSDVIDITTFMPFNLNRYIPAMKFKFNIGDNNVSDLNPIYIINRVDELCNYVTKYMKNDKHNQLAKIILKSYLASKMIIVKYKLNKICFDFIIKDLEKIILNAIVEPGEMVGPVAAQSLGEANTQLTLNSIEWNEKIMIKDNGIIKVVKIGEFIDNIINNTFDNSLIENYPNDTTLRWTKNTNNFEVISVDENGIISWKKIEAVTKHPVINEDGSDTLIKVTTKTGKTVIATKGKSFLIRKNNKIIPINGSEFCNYNDINEISSYKLPIMKKFPFDNNELIYKIYLIENLKNYIPNLILDIHDKNFMDNLFLNLFKNFGSFDSGIIFIHKSEDLIDIIMNFMSVFSIISEKFFNDNKWNLYINCYSKEVREHIENNSPSIIKLLQENNNNKNLDIIAGNYTKHFKGEFNRIELINALDDNNIKNTDEFFILEKAVNSNVYFDSIIDVQEFKSDNKYVYDLTVEDTITFVLFNTLCQNDTFHQAGAAAGSVVVTAGVPRMKEIINLSRNMKTPSMELYLKKEYSSDRKKAEEVKNQIEYTKLKDLVYRTEIIYEDIDKVSIDIDNNEDLEFIKLYNEFNELICVDNHDDLSKWVLRIEFDRENMMSKNILMMDIQEAILQNSQTEDDIQCIINDDNSSNLIMRVRIKSEMDDEYFLSFLKDLEKHILDMTLRGVRGIKSADLVEGNIVRYDPDGSYKIEKEWFLRTDGSNLNETLLLDYIDSTRSKTNDIVETYEIFGIEGVRFRIFDELDKLFSNEGINQRHINLLADIMTHRGVIMQIDRHGINRSPDNGVLAKASFEEVTDIFMKAAIFAENDKMNGVSANIMFGQPPLAGTNSFQLLLDEEKIINNSFIDDNLSFEPDELDENTVQDEINKMYENIDDELMVYDSDFDFGYSLENIQEYNIGTIRKDNNKKIVNVVNKSPNKKIKIKIKK
jgi:DNA-directed RNA polymerase beta' subunit